MTTPAEPTPQAPDPIDAVLRIAYTGLVNDLRDRLDLATGIEQATEPGLYQDLTDDLARQLDVEGGLVAITGGALTTPTKDQQRQTESGNDDDIGVAAAEDVGRESDIASKLGVEPGMVVQEIGWDSDVDEVVRDAVEERCGDDLLDEDADEVIDLVLLWWREGDGDLIDALINAIGPLADNGVIWVLTPKTGRSGHVEPIEIAKAAPNAGLSLTLELNVGAGWAGIRLVTPKAIKSRR